MLRHAPFWCVSFLKTLMQIYYPALRPLPKSNSIAAHYPACLYPRDAVLRHPDGGRSVFTVSSDNKVTRKQVTVSHEGNQSVVITDGISQQDRIVLRGNEVLQEGDAVRIVEDR